MKKEDIKLFLLINISTTILLYLIISFINWNITWVSELPNYSVSDRVGILLVFMLKTTIDMLIKSLIKI